MSRDRTEDDRRSALPHGSEGHMTSANAAGTRRIRFIEPGSSVGGRRFEARRERELHSLATSVAETLPGPVGEVLLVPEMPSPLGMPDFVAVIGARDWLIRRAELAVPPILSEIDCQALSVLTEQRALSFRVVAARLGWEVGHLEPALARLERAGAVVRTESGAAVVVPGIRPTGRILAIETKVRDWKRALIQGRGYRTWANNYVIVLGDVGRAAVERAKSEIGADGAGLFTEAGWVVKPRSRNPAASRHIQGFEYVFAAIGSSPALVGDE